MAVWKYASGTEQPKKFVAVVKELKQVYVLTEDEYHDLIGKRLEKNEPTKSIR